MPQSHEMYSKAKVKVAVPERPSLTFATLAAPLIQAKHKVEILDLDMVKAPAEELEKKLNEFSPDYVGMTCTTPLVHKVHHIASVVKQYNPNTIVIAGGPHPSSFPKDTLADSDLDIICIGEGDFTLIDLRQRDFGCTSLSDIQHEF